MRALVSASKNVPKHRSKALMSLYMYLPTLFISLKPWKGIALLGFTEVNKIKLKNVKNVKFAIAILLFSFIDVKLQLNDSLYNTTIIQKSSYSNSNSSTVYELLCFLFVFVKNPLSICTNHIAGFFIIYVENKRPTETRVNLKKKLKLI